MLKNFFLLLALLIKPCLAMESENDREYHYSALAALTQSWEENSAFFDFSINKMVLLNEKFNFAQPKGLVTLSELRDVKITKMAILLKTIKENKVTIHAWMQDRESFIREKDSNPQWKPYSVIQDGDNRISFQLNKDGIYEVLVPEDASINVDGSKSFIKLETATGHIKCSSSYGYPTAKFRKCGCSGNCLNVINVRSDYTPQVSLQSNNYIEVSNNEH